MPGKYIEESQSGPCLPWKPVWEKGVKARTLKSFHCRNFGLWVQLAASRQCTLHTAEDQLHNVCRRVHEAGREGEFTALA